MCCWNTSTVRNQTLSFPAHGCWSHCAQYAELRVVGNLRPNSMFHKEEQIQSSAQKAVSVSWEIRRKQPLISDFLEQFCFKPSYFEVSEGFSVLIGARVLTGWGWVERLGRCRSRSKQKLSGRTVHVRVTKKGHELLQQARLVYLFSPFSISSIKQKLGLSWVEEEEWQDVELGALVRANSLW